MKAIVLYRIAAVLFVLFAVGHTIGFLSFKPPTPEGIAVRDGMNNVHFAVGKATFSYGGFYEGFGLSATASMLFSAFLAWYLRDWPGATRLRLARWPGLSWDCKWCRLSRVWFISL